MATATVEKVRVTPEPETRIPYGAGYDAPTFVARGTVAERRAQIIEEFGLEKTKANTNVELTVEAALVAHALVNASTLGAKPDSAALDANPEPKIDFGDEEKRKALENAPESTTQRAATRQGIAGKKRGRPKSIEKQVAEAKTEEELAGVYRANAAKITEEQLKIFSARKEAIRKEAS